MLKCGNYKNLAECCVIWRNLAEFDGKCKMRNLEECGGMWRNVAESGGLLRNVAEFGGIWRNLAEFGGTLNFSSNDLS